jgi:hypothetical protein
MLRLTALSVTPIPAPLIDPPPSTLVPVAEGSAPYPLVATAFCPDNVTPRSRAPTPLGSRRRQGTTDLHARR